MLDFVQLSVLTTKIAEFDRANTIIYGDIFLGARNSNDTDDIESKKLRVPAISAYVLDGIEKQQNFVPFGQWNFHKPNGMINIPLSAVEDDQDDQDVPNLEYIYKYLISELDKLSNQLYTDDLSKKYLPSYTGMVVLGTTDKFNSQADLRRIYGQHTEWKKIEGRFLLGAGSCEGNNTSGDGSCSSGEINTNAKSYGGVSEVTINYIPKHIHKFNGVNSPDRFPERDITKFGVETEIISEKLSKVRRPGNKWKHRGSDFHNHPSRPYVYNVKKEFDTSTTLEKITQKFSFTADGTIEDSYDTANAPLNNIPPYKTICIWERIDDDTIKR